MREEQSPTLCVLPHAMLCLGEGTGSEQSLSVKDKSLAYVTKITMDSPAELTESKNLEEVVDVWNKNWSNKE